MFKNTKTHYGDNCERFLRLPSAQPVESSWSPAQRKKISLLFLLVIAFFRHRSSRQGRQRQRSPSVSAFDPSVIPVTLRIRLHTLAWWAATCGRSGLSLSLSPPFTAVVPFPPPPQMPFSLHGIKKLTQIACRSKCKMKTVELLEKHIGECFSDPGVGHNFLRTWKVLTIKTQIHLTMLI